jgi:hypothetical protein
MSHSDNAKTVTAAATSQVKLCPYMRRNQPSGSASSMRSSPRHQITETQVRNALASLPKQSFGTFWTQSIFATNEINLLIF